MTDKTVSACSNCHNATMKIRGDVTKYYVCGVCHRPCDPAPTNPPTETVSDLESKILSKIGQCKQPIGYSCEYCSALHDVLAMLRQPSEHDLELIREGHQRSDRDTRRGV